MLIEPPFMFCHACKVALHAHEGQLQDSAGEYCCRSCGSDLVEFIGSNEERNELLSSGFANLSNSVTVTVVQSSWNQSSVPTLADLIRQEVFFAQQRSPHGLSAESPDYIRSVMHTILMQHEPQSRPTPPHVVDSFQRATNHQVQRDESCAICCETMSARDTTRMLLRLPCDHWFHEECVRPWLEMSTTCPTCRHATV